MVAGGRASRCLVLLLAAWPGDATAAEPLTVVSDRADAVSVTIYRDGMALVTETRNVDLPADAHRLVLRNVADTLLPQSAVMDGQLRPLASTDFRDNRLTARTLVAASVGEAVTLTRTDRATGRVTTTTATIAAANEGIVLETAAGTEAMYCSGLPEQLTFSRIPEGLSATPELSVDLAAGAAGPRALRISYLAGGFAWKAEYRAMLDAQGKHMQLQGWMTLTNQSGISFRNADVQAVAGDLNLLPVSQGGTGGLSARDGGIRAPVTTPMGRTRAPAFPTRVLSRCYNLGRTRGVPAPRPSPAPARARLTQSMDSVSPLTTIGAEGEEIIVTGSRIVRRESLGDYQLYRMPERTDLMARQEKQVAFLQKDDVRVERLYALRLYAGDEPNGLQRPDLALQTRNEVSSGLGEPLPAGTFWLFEPGPTGPILAGTARLGDNAVGLPLELTFAQALDLMIDMRTGEHDERGFRWRRVKGQARSAKPVAVQIELRQEPLNGETRVTRVSQRAARKYGDFMWRLQVPAYGEASLDYTLKTPLRRRRD